MKIKKSRLLTIIQEEISRLDEARPREEESGVVDAEDIQMKKIDQGRMLGKTLGKEEQKKLANIAIAGIESGEYKIENSEANRALNDLLGSYYNFVFNVVSKNKRDDPGEMAQEAMVKAYLSLESFRKDSNFGTWLYRIASNKAIDFGRKSQRDLETTDQSVPIDDLKDLEDNEDSILYPIRQRTPNPLEALIQKQGLKKFEEALEEFSGTGAAAADAAQALKLNRLEGISQQKIADMFHIDQGVVSRRISAAIAGVKKIMSKNSLEETIKNTILEMDDDSSDLPPGLVPANDDLRDSIRADVDEMHPGLKDWNQDVYEGLVDFIASNYEAEDADLRKDGYLPPKKLEFDYVGYKDPGSLGKFGDLKEAIKEALKDLI